MSGGVRDPHAERIRQRRCGDPGLPGPAGFLEGRGTGLNVTVGGKHDR